MTEIIGLILSCLGALFLAGLFYVATHKFLVSLIIFILAAGYLYGKWVEAGTPYDIRDIRNELKKK